jgi:hypothetical protein
LTFYENIKRDLGIIVKIARGVKVKVGQVIEDPCAGFREQELA